MTDKYNLKIPQELVNFFKNYIKNHKELGFTFVSKYLLYILQIEAKKLMEEELEKKENKKITLTSGDYTREELEKLIKES